MPERLTIQNLDPDIYSGFLNQQTHPDVRDAVALLIGTELWGLITPSAASDKDLDLDIPAIRAATAALQPYYAVPTRWLVLPALPMTSRGKVDKRVLSALAMERAAVDGLNLAPTSGRACTSSV